MPCTFLEVRGIILATMFTFGLAALVVASIALGVTMPSEAAAGPLREALSWGVSDGCITIVWILISIFPAMAPGLLTLPIIFEALFTLALPIIHIAATAVAKRQSLRSCSGTEIEGACSVMKAYLWPLMILLTIISLIYALVLSFVLISRRGEQLDLILGDIYTLSWPYASEEVDDYSAKLDNPRGVPSAWRSPPGQGKTTKISADMIRRVDEPDHIWDDFEDVELGLDGEEITYPTATPPNRSTTYGGKVPMNGFQHDHRPAWARRLSVVRGRQQPFPAVRALQALVRPPIPAHTNVGRRPSLIDLPGMRQFPSEPPTHVASPTITWYSSDQESPSRLISPPPREEPRFNEKNGHLAVPYTHNQGSASTFPSLYSAPSASRSHEAMPTDRSWWQRPISMARTLKSAKSGRSAPRPKVQEDYDSHGF